ETRRKLSDLLNKLDGNDRLDELLQEVIASTDSLLQLGTEAGVVHAAEPKNAEKRRKRWEIRNSKHRLRPRRSWRSGGFWNRSSRMAVSPAVRPRKATPGT